jgi:hypothetical protein
MKKAISVIEKQEIIKLIEIEKKTQETVAMIYNCDRTIISKFIKNKDQLEFN